MLRRHFLSGAAAGLGALAAGCRPPEQAAADLARPDPAEDRPFVGPPAPYHGPNVILIRFGGGVRRLETIADASNTWCPFIVQELGKEGILFPDVDIASAPDIVTSHGQGTLYLLTGQYDHYEDITRKPFSDRFEPKAPTLFEYFRRYYHVPEHQALIINGEDRVNEEFYTFSNHHLYGVRYRSTVLSLYRFKTYLLGKQLADPDLPDGERTAKEKQLREMETKDYRVKDLKVASPELDGFWGLCYVIAVQGGSRTLVYAVQRGGCARVRVTNFHNCHPYNHF